MELFALRSLIILGFAQFSRAQDSVHVRKQNSISDLSGVTAEAAQPPIGALQLSQRTLVS